MSEQVRDMFAEIADTYDSTNSVLSLGIHHLWRKKTVRESGAKAGHHVLDCATGTGDLALEFRKTVGAQGRVVGTDFCKEMLDFAPPKAASAGFPDVEWEVQDAMNLTYADDTFDIASISFGIRNVDDPVQGVRSMARGQQGGRRRPDAGFFRISVKPKPVRRVGTGAGKIPGLPPGCPQEFPVECKGQTTAIETRRRTNHSLPELGGSRYQVSAGRSRSGGSLPLLRPRVGAHPP